jgi:hypothetical protein
MPAPTPRRWPHVVRCGSSHANRSPVSHGVTHGVAPGARGHGGIPDRPVPLAVRAMYAPMSSAPGSASRIRFPSVEGVVVGSRASISRNRSRSRSSRLCSKMYSGFTASLSRLSSRTSPMAFIRNDHGRGDVSRGETPWRADASQLLRGEQGAAIRLKREPGLTRRPVADVLDRGRFTAGGRAMRVSAAKWPHTARGSRPTNGSGGFTEPSAAVSTGCYFVPRRASRACLTPALSSIRVPCSQCIEAARRCGRHCGLAYR